VVAGDLESVGWGGVKQPDALAVATMMMPLVANELLLDMFSRDMRVPSPCLLASQAHPEVVFVLVWTNRSYVKPTKASPNPGLILEAICQCKTK